MTADIARAGALPRGRFVVAIVLFVTVVINYLDRLNISIAAAEGKMQTDLGISQEEMGAVFSSWGTAYLLCQIPGGLMADRIRPRLLYPILLVAWSLATVVQGMAGTIMVLVICRVLVGIFEAPSYPINNRVVTSWFPEGERAGAIAFYTSGQFLGFAFLSFLLVWFQAEYGWRWLFYACGLAGIVWAMVFTALYKDPDQSRSLTEENRQALRDGGAVVDWSESDAKAKRLPTVSEVMTVLGSRKLWGIYIGQFCIGTVTIFFLTWFPSFLTQSRGIDFKESALWIATPYMGAFFGILLSGLLSDFMVRRGVEQGLARKAPIIIGVLLSSTILCSLWVESDEAVLFFLTLAFFGNGLSSIAWIFVSLLAPTRLLGAVGGVFNTIGGLSAVVTPWVFGKLIDDTDYSAGLVYVTIVALFAIFAYTVLVGRVERVAIAEPAPS